MQKLSSLPIRSRWAAAGLAAGCALWLAGCAPQPEAGGGIGEALYRLVVGGQEVGAITLLRFYAWHVMGLAVPLLLLMVWHGFRVRRDGGVSSPERAPGDPPLPRVERAVMVRREVLTFLLTLAALVLLAVFVEPPIGPPAQPGALVEDTQAPWIFLWIQELLRIWPPAIAGVLAPLAVLLILALLPYLDWSNEGVAVWFNRQGRAAQIVLIILFLLILALTVRAALR
ncbi:MAG: hypothetical protein Kow00124_08710 [Anaerolineae bacterium]